MDVQDKFAILKKIKINVMINQKYLKKWQEIIVNKHNNDYQIEFKANIVQVINKVNHVYLNNRELL